MRPKLLRNTLIRVNKINSFGQPRKGKYLQVRLNEILQVCAKKTVFVANILYYTPIVIAPFSCFRSGR